MRLAIELKIMIQTLSVNQWIKSTDSKGWRGEGSIFHGNIWTEISAGASSIGWDGSCPKSLLLESQADFLVGIIITSVRKIFRTSWTLEWPLTGMYSLMCLKKILNY